MSTSTPAGAGGPAVDKAGAAGQRERREATTISPFLWLLVFGTIAVPLALFALASWRNYHDLEDETRSYMNRTLDLVHAHAVKVFETEELLAAYVQDTLEGLSDAQIQASESEIHERLARIARRLPQTQDIWVLDRDGKPLVSSHAHPMPAGAGFGDRQYFLAHKAGAPTYVSGILRGPVVDQEFFQYSKRREEKGGAFAGVIAISMPPGYFVDLYSKISETRDFTASMVREDGTLLVRHPAPRLGALGSRLSETSGLMKSIRLSPDGGLYYTDSSQFDAVPRLFAYRKLPGLPLYVIVGFSTDEIRKAWMLGMGSYVIFGGPVTVALFALSLLVVRRKRRLALMNERLQQEIDRRQVAEEGLRQAQKMEAIGRLTGGIAHDFNNLLTAIGGAVELISKRLGPDNEQVTRLIDVARTGVSRAASLTQRLLAFARQQPLQVETVQVNRVVAGMSELLRRTLGEGIRIETVLAGGLWPVATDPAQLESAILNLAINARDAMPDGGRLTIETANAHLDEAYAASHAEVAAGQYVMIAVSDTGVGMTPETIREAFEPFFTTKERGQGTGLGLSMVYGYAKQSSGHVKIYSEVGQGTTVKIYLPRLSGVASDDNHEVPTAPKPTVASPGAVPVLVVEDEAIVRLFSVSAFRELGYEVFEAGNGPAALAILQQHPGIGLLFTDIGLPGGMTGRQLAAEAGRLRPGLTVLFTTGYTSNAIIHRGTLDPGVNFLGKPFSIVQLAAKLRAMRLLPGPARS